MRWKLLAGVAALAVMLATPFAAAQAFGLRHGNNVIVEKTETISGNLYAAGSQIVVDGTVNGDLFCAGATVTVNGTVNGDIICAGSSITVNGAVTGDVRSASSELSVNGKVGGGMLSFGSALNVNSTASVGSNILAFGATLRADGPVGGDIQFFGASLLLNNKVGGDVTFYTEPARDKKSEPAMSLRPQANVSGNLSYYEGTDVNLSDGAAVSGETVVIQPKPYPAGAQSAKKFLAGFGLIWLLWGVIGGIIIGFVLVGFFPRQVRATLDTMLERPGASLGWGFVTAVVTPIVMVLLLITVVGIPLALLAGALFAAMCMLMKVLGAVGIGALLAHWFKWKLSLYWLVVIGVIVAAIIYIIPIIGWIVGVLAFFWAFGGAVLHKKAVYKQLEE
jgi:hypothetical protein